MGQVVEAPRIVELKDGSRLLGRVISETEYAIELVIATGDTLDISYKYISQVGTNNDIRIRKIKKKLPNVHLEKLTIYKISLGPTFSDDGETGFIASAEAYRRVSSRLLIGGGVGYSKLVLPVNGYFLSMNYVPLYAVFQLNLSNAKIRPYIQSNVGYGIGLENSSFLFQASNTYESGLFGQLSIGVDIANSKSYKANVAFTTLIQRTNGLLEGLDWNTNLPFTSNYESTIIRPGIIVGISF